MFYYNNTYTNTETPEYRQAKNGVQQVISVVSFFCLCSPEIPYHPSKVGKVEDEEGGSGGSVPLRMSLVSLALVHAVVLMFS